MRPIYEQLEVGAVLPRHWHGRAYLTLITDGEYIEAGDQGRFHARPGDILVHEQFVSHANWVVSRLPVRTVNIEFDRTGEMPAYSEATDFESTLRLVNSDKQTAINDLLTSLVPKMQLNTDWPDALAKGIRDDPTKTIHHWSRVFGLAAGTISRGFKRAFGVSAARYRATARARHAFRLLSTDNMSLAELAQASGFSDQAHLTRDIRALTGAPPSYWRLRQKSSRPALH